jgi:cytochrome bd ubiquinol oxidase subunit I
MKIAAIEAMWDTEPAPASFTIVGLPDQASHTTHYAIRVPWVLGLIATRSVDTPVAGVNQLVQQASVRIKSGVIAYGAMEQLRRRPSDPGVAASLTGAFNAHVNDLGYALLLKRYAPNVIDATPAQIEAAALDTTPQVAPLFWSFRVMVGLGLGFIALFAVAFWLASRRQLERWRWFLRLCVWVLPAPWIAAELGWIVSETGRQPWTIDGVLPTFLSVSSTPASNVWISLSLFVLLYSGLAVVELMLMVRAIRAGPAADGEAGHA